MTLPQDRRPQDEDRPDGAGAPAAAARATDAWLVVIFLTAVAVLNLADRFLPAILADSIKRDLQLSDTALGLITGAGFMVIYAVAGIPIARLTDRGLYGWVISACLGLWSVMTLAGGFASTAWRLAATRTGVAVGEAGGLPAAHAYISHHFAPDRRAAPLAVLTLYVPLGGMASLVIGGLIGERLGWRVTFVVMGAIGLAATPIALALVKNTARLPSAPDAQARPISPILPYLGTRSMVMLMAASAFIGVGGYSTSIFAPAFLMRSHHLGIGEVGLDFGLLTGLFGAVGLLVTGPIADRLSTKDPRWLLGVVVAEIALAAPLALIGYTAAAPWLSMVCIGASTLMTSAYLAPVVGALHRLVPPGSRARASAILLLVSALVGSLGPVAVGRISDALQPRFGQGALGHALLLTPTAFTLAGLLYLVAALRLDRDIIPEMSASDLNMD